MASGKNILVLAANPVDTAQLKLDTEVREIEHGLKLGRQRDQYALQKVFAARPADARRAMLEYKPAVVHFCGHGEGGAGIAFEGPDGQTRLVSTEALANFFKLFSAQVQCVVLNACYSEVQADAIARHIEYVIGMDKAVSDQAAIEFAVAFYDALAAGENVEFAYQLGRNAIEMAGIPEHLTPALKSRTARPVETAKDFQTFAGMTVFLAEVSDDLQPRRQALKTALEQQQIKVHPQKFYGFPEKEELHRAMDADLQQADLYVQLLSGVTRQSFPNYHIATPVNQYERAALRADLPLLQWRERDTDEAADDAQRTLLEGSAVVVSPFEEFKQYVTQKLAQTAAQKQAAPPASGATRGAAMGGGGLVFIDTLPDALQLAREIGSRLKAEGFSASLPLSGAASAAEAREDLEDNLYDCDAVLILCTHNTRWLRQQLRACVKACARRDEEIKLIALYNPYSAVPELDMDINLRVEWLECPTPQASECLTKFIEIISHGGTKARRY
ncbi:MAG: CHAT domain-containing protein [Gammaproteobacteria bacterium]|nr:CHAT domain-containing protein [Gammaproteobacteria bacterium]